MKKIIKYSITSLLALPLLTSAQQNDISSSDLGSFIISIQGFINDILIPLVFAVALLFFLYGIFNYFIVGQNQVDKKSEGKSYIIWSITGFVIMVSIWGIVAILASVIPSSGSPEIPSIPSL